MVKSSLSKNTKLIQVYEFSSIDENTVAAHLRAANGLRAAFGKILLHKNSSLCTVTFGEKVLTLATSRGYLEDAIDATVNTK